ncbi:MAG: cytochrome P450 [Verrucomicrobiota bacterium]
MLKTLRSTWNDLRHLARARDNVIAAWPKSYYRRELIPVRCLHRWMFVINNPEGVQRVMVGNAKNYRKSPGNTQMLKPLLGNGLFVSEGELWQRQRRMSNPAVHGSRLQGYSKIITAAGEKLLAGWREHGDGHEEDVTETFTLLTADIISEIMFGYALGDRVHTLYDAFVEYQASHGRMHLTEFLGLPAWLPRPGQWRGRRAVAKFDEVLAEILAAGRAANGGESPDNFLHMLLAFRDDEGRPMEPSLIRDEMASIFLAGHETTAITLGWALWLLEKHPEVEARLLAELDRVLTGRPPTFEDAPNLPYTRAVIDETLRLYPPVHTFTRQAIGPDEVSGQKIAAGQFVTITSWVLHRHTLYWEEPEVFKPERFLPGATQKIDQRAYIPFGAGARICLGKHLGLLESTLLLAMIAQSFRLRLRPGHLVEPLGRMTLRPRHGLPMRIERRR